MISDDPSQSLAHSGFGRRNEHEYGYGHNQTGIFQNEPSKSDDN